MYYYIYIPGLGGKKSIDWQKRTIKKWDSANRQAYVVDAMWHDKQETFSQKYSRVLKEAKEFIKDKDGKFCVVGASAGGSMAMIILEALRLDGSVTIAGKLSGSGSIGDSYHQAAPTLREAVRHSEGVLSSLSGERKQSILTISPLIDEVVSKKDMVIKGSKNNNLKVPGHVLTISYMLLFGKNKIFKWFERLA